MNLQNSRYDAILRQYDSRRFHAKYVLDKRTEQIYNECPEILDIDNLIASESISRAKRALMGEAGALEGLAEDNRRLSEKKEQLLVAHGYPADYLKPKYECELCKDTGFIGQEQCSCFKRALSKLVYDESNVKEMISNQNFSNFDYSLYSNDPADTDSQLKATPRANIVRCVNTAQDFIRNFDNTHQNLLIYGNVGVGKTFLTNCIAKELLDSGHSVIYYTAFRLFDYLEKVRFGGSREDSTEYSFDRLIDCDLLIVDDLGTEVDNTFTSSQLYSLVNERSLAGRSTVFSTNYTLNELLVKYTERVLSRFTENYTFLKIIGKDIRRNR